MKKYDDVTYFDEGLSLVLLNNKYGFINKQGQEVIPLIYDDVYYFNKGLTQVKLNDKWGVINLQGKEVIPCIYNGLYNLNENYYIGKIDNSYYLIDRNNYTSTKCNKKVYENIGSSEDDLYVYYIAEYNIVLFEVGDFRGNLEEFKEKIKNQYYKDNNLYEKYINIIKEYEK